EENPVDERIVAESGTPSGSVGWLAAAVPDAFASSRWRLSVREVRAPSHAPSPKQVSDMWTLILGVTFPS
ncbi:MAG TPA: hypothetical protein VJM33_20150, partial [Microthrixaceae bacterium]|nr:hypothetical protein [Microthrixaceae bacterium]